MLLVMAALICAACGARAKKAAETPSVEAAGVEVAGEPKQVPVAEYNHPPIPTALEGPVEQMKWLAEHYWDNFEFADTTRVERWSAVFEQALVNAIYGMQQSGVRDKDGARLMGSIFARASVNKGAFMAAADITERYLNDPNSPMRNETYYIGALEGMLASPILDKYERIRPTEQLRIAMKNRPGTRAADFRYTLADGSTGTLYGFKSPHTLLFINNPGCPACRQTMEQIMASEYLTGEIKRGNLRVLAIYPDADLARWREYAVNFPSSWVNSYDAATRIKEAELYDLRAIPTMYLLDLNKLVLLKDVMSIPLIEQTLKNR